MNVDELLEHTRKVAVERIGPKLGPDDDWVAAVFLEDMCGQMQAVALMFNNELEKALAYGVAVPALISGHGAVVVVTVNTAWVTIPDEERKFEALVIGGYDWTGKSRAWMGEITRSPKGVSVEEEAEVSDVEGGVPDPILAALARNANERGLGRN